MVNYIVTGNGRHVPFILQKNKSVCKPLTHTKYFTTIMIRYQKGIFFCETYVKKKEIGYFEDNNIVKGGEYACNGMPNSW